MPIPFCSSWLSSAQTGGFCRFTRVFLNISVWRNRGFRAKDEKTFVFHRSWTCVDVHGKNILFQQLLTSEVAISSSYKFVCGEGFWKGKVVWSVYTQNVWMCMVRTFFSTTFNKWSRSSHLHDLELVQICVWRGVLKRQSCIECVHPSPKETQL